MNTIQHNILTNYTSFERKEQIHERLEKQLQQFNSNLENLSENEIQNFLSFHSTKQGGQGEDICFGLLAKILTDPKNASKYINYLTNISNDSVTTVANIVKNLCNNSKFSKFQELPTLQFLFLLQEFIRLRLEDSICEDLCTNLLRQITGGDLSEKNLNFCKEMFSFLERNYVWLLEHPMLIRRVVYNYLRLLQDHVKVPKLETFKNKEVAFLLSLMKIKWDEVQLIGRDLYRLLVCLKSIPSFQKLIEEMINQPQGISPNFIGLQALLQQRTSKTFHFNRIPFDLDEKIRFLLRNVKKHQAPTYYSWIQKEWLSTDFSVTLKQDIIRFVVTCIHPTNDLLASDVVPRYEFLKLLLNYEPPQSQNLTALTWDWYFSTNSKQIMDVEPGALLMARSTPNLSFNIVVGMCKYLKYEFPPSLYNLLNNGIQTTLDFIMKLQVLKNIQPILHTIQNFPRSNDEITQLVRTVFGKHYNFDNHGSVPLQFNQPPLLQVPDQGNQDKRPSSSPIQDQPSEESDPAEFSSDEDTDIKQVQGTEPRDSNQFPDDNIEPLEALPNLPDDKQLLKLLKDFQLPLDISNEKDDDSREQMISICKQAENTFVNWNSNQEKGFARCVIKLHKTQLKKLNFEQLSESCSPFVSSFQKKSIYQVYKSVLTSFKKRKEDTDATNRFKKWQNILVTMRETDRFTSSLLLFCLSIQKPSKQPIDGRLLYRMFAKHTILGEISKCLIDDFQFMEREQPVLLVHMVPYLYKTFRVELVDSKDCHQFIKCVVGAIYPKKLEQLQFSIMCGELIMTTEDKAMQTLEKSLDWSSFEQYSIWKLLFSHDIPLDPVLPLLVKLDENHHPEALTSVLAILKHVKPTQTILRHILTRRCVNEDKFTLSLLRHWAMNYSNELAASVSTLLTKQNKMQNPTKRPMRSRILKGRSSKSNSSSNQNTINDMLKHLESLRKCNLSKSCKFFTEDSLCAAFFYLKDNLESFQEDHKDLIKAVLPDEDDSESPVYKSKKRNNNRKKVYQEVSDESEHSSEEENNIPPKKRKKLNNSSSSKQIIKLSSSESD